MSATQTVMNKSAVRPSLPTRARRVSSRVTATAQPKISSGAKFAGASIVSLGALAQVHPALANESDAVDSAISTIIDVVKATGGAVKTGLDAVNTGVQIVQQGVDVAAPVVKQGVDIVGPVVERAVRITGDVAAPALKEVAPALQEASKLVQNSGIDVKTITSTTDAVVKTTTEAATSATPFLQQFLSFLAAKDPVTLGEYGIATIAFYFLAPSLFGALIGSLRGFAGEITAATALDALNNESNTVLIDIRSDKEKEGSGVPDVPSGAGGKLLDVEFCATEDKKLRNQLRDANSIEAQVTALQIASLKKISKSSKVILLDRYGNISKVVARELSTRGFTKVYVVSGGFDGRGGWVASKLQIKPSAVVTSASSVSPFGTLAKTLSTRVTGRKALPSPKI